MTKFFEEYIYINIDQFKTFDKEIRGEITVVVSNILEEGKKVDILSEAIKIEIINMLKKYSIKDVVYYISKKEDISKKIVYNYCLKQKNENNFITYISFIFFIFMCWHIL